MTKIDANNVDSIIAKTTLGLIKESTKLDPGRSDEGGQTFRLKNLTANEIHEILSRWTEFADGTSLGAMKVVVAGDFDGDYPEEFRAKEGRSITWYRNNIEKNAGLIYIQTKVESDSSGLENLFTLRDNNFLDGSFDTEELTVPQRIFASSWAVAGGKESELPSLICRYVEEALGYIHPKPSPVSARKFARFCLAVSKARLATNGNMETGEIEAMVGQHLVELDLFADERWRITPSRSGRRLVQNSLHADLAGSPTADLDLEKLVEICDKTVFRGEGGDELAQADIKKWRQRCTEYIRTQSRDVRKEIPYTIFEQLFTKDVTGMPLGERVENEIIEGNLDRLPEFQSLGVKAGLDKREADDAQRFLDSHTENGVVPMHDLLTRQTQRMVEKAANPSTERIVNPISKIGEVAATFRESCPDTTDATIELKPGHDFDETSPTVGLFAFLFSGTLKAVCESPVAGYAMRVDDRLMNVRAAPGLVEASQDDSEDQPDVNWKAVPIVYCLVSNDGDKELAAETNLEWFPDSIERLVLFWLFCSANDAPDSDAILAIPGNATLENWMDDVAERRVPVNSCATSNWSADVTESPVIGRLFELLSSLRKTISTDGISAATLNDHFDCWSQILLDAKAQFVPDGKTDDRLGAFLAACCIDTDAAGSRMMLPTHPLRLRWLAQYLRESESLAINSLAGDLHLNKQNEQLYLNLFAARSPHQQPAVSCTRDRRILMACGESGWTEQFIVPDTDNMSISVNEAATSVEICREVEEYLNAHPHRGDGLSILVAMNRHSSLASELVRMIRRGIWRGISLTVHVVVDRTQYDDIINEFEAIPSENRFSQGSEMFPPIQLRLHEFPADGKFSQLAHDIRCDIAIAAHFLSNEISLTHNTSPDETKEGSFDVLLDEPTYVRGGLQGGSITVSTLPENPDAPLGMWSTLVVRHNRASPVSTQQPGEYGLSRTDA